MRFHKSQEPAMLSVGGHSGVGKSSFIQTFFDQIFARPDLSRPPVLLRVPLPFLSYYVKILMEYRENMIGSNILHTVR